jgi:Zn-dependent protease
MSTPNDPRERPEPGSLGPPLGTPSQPPSTPPSWDLATRDEAARRSEWMLGSEAAPAPAPSRPAPPDHDARREHPWWRRGLGLLAAIGFIVFKFGAKLKALLLLLPKVKLFSTSITMLVSIAAYALIWGWRFAVGFVLLLFVHEMGHVLQARREGIRTSAPMFIPFLGALIMLRDRERDAAVEARIGLAGPILGALGCLVPLALYVSTGEAFWGALAFTGFFLNLFNLLPVLPLDGGRAMAALSPWMWIVGYAILVAATFAFPNPVMLIILLFGGMETWHRWRARKSPEAQAFHRVPGRTRWAVAATYVGLAVALAGGMQASFVERDLDDARQGSSPPVQAG